MPTRQAVYHKAHKKLSQTEKATLDTALERGLDPSELEGGFPWGALFAILSPLIAELGKKGVEAFTGWIRSKIGRGLIPSGASGGLLYPSGKQGSGYVHLMPYERGNTYPMPSHRMPGSSVLNKGGRGINNVALENVKRQLEPYLKDPAKFKAKLEQMVQQALAKSKSGSGVREYIMNTLGNGTTTGAQLEKVARDIFGSKFIGVYDATDSKPPELLDGQIAILWKAGHWFGIYKKNGRLFESDSYEIDHLGKKYANQDIPNNQRQSFDETNCGQRLLINLCRVIF